MKWEKFSRRWWPENDFRETANRFRETGNGFREVPNGFRETGNGFREVPNGFRETGNGFREVPNGFRETGNGFREVPNRFRETGNGFREVPNRFRELGNAFREADKSVLRQTMNAELPRRLRRHPFTEGELARHPERSAAGAESKDRHSTVQPFAGERAAEVGRAGPSTPPLRGSAQDDE
ncbi:MAG: hypothetical protein LBK60_09455 [Verrucomicrobiales bacterium]|nr:hypothetical protein [Verrucomicrobiales bacterium]